jgi:cytochrome c556
VHLPLKYDGISESEQASLAKAIKVLPPTVYVHCQHGVHRAPAAASVGLIGLDQMTVGQGIQVLTLAGTSPDYPGLWSAVELMKPLEASAIESLAVDPLPKVSKVSDQAALMADVDRIFEDLKSVSRDKLPVAADGAFLRDVLRQLASGAESSELQTGFAKASLLAARVEEAIRKRDHVATQEALFRLGAACNVCHRSHRDIVD